MRLHPWGFLSTLLAFLTACSNDPSDKPSGPKYTAPEYSTFDSAEKALQARGSAKDAVAFWIAQLKSTDARLVMYAIGDLEKTADPRALEALTKMLPSLPKSEAEEHHELTEATVVAIESIRSNIVWESSITPYIGTREFVPRALSAWQKHGRNHEFSTRLKAFLLKENDPRAIPFYLWNGTDECLKKVESFGDQAKPYLLEELRLPGFLISKRTAVFLCGRLRIEDALPLIMSNLLEIRSSHLSGETFSFDAAQMKTQCSEALTQYRNVAIPSIRKHLDHPDEKIRDELYHALGRMQTEESIAVLKEAQRTESSQIAIKTIQWWVGKYEGGHK